MAKASPGLKAKSYRELRARVRAFMQAGARGATSLPALTSQEETMARADTFIPQSALLAGARL